MRFVIFIYEKTAKVKNTFSMKREATIIFLTRNISPWSEEENQ